ncbi:MAG: VIT and VWA domain-containing protein, partial [Deltaproteobacteria bacterium]|nr:VIT and VWA domain-containing protein [Deltaproteobacteria bacterium]
MAYFHSDYHQEKNAMATALSFYYPTEPGVFASHGQSISLKSVSIKGEIKGLSLKLSVRQSYQNDTGENLEIVYVFPVAYGCELMGLKVTHNGKAKTGKVYPKKTAWQKYEEAIDEGDSPILVETNSPGLFTANLGNVLPGDEIQVEYSYFELLKFEVDQIRVVVPTTVAPRYGDLKETGELKEHESIEPSLTARYPLELAIDVVGDLAESSISSPNHSIETSFAPGLATVALANGAIMDRDFVLILKRVKALEKSFALCAYDPVEKRHAVLASFCPTVPGLTEPIALKILVDCSGSMAGSSIAEAVRGLGSVIDRLTPDDYVAYSRFGSDVIHDSRKLLRCDSKNLRILREFVSQTDA